ncbi:MAG: hypothetical protein M1823_005600 [Watsoniomyces obsoletus]|nr:MAG: hypothetical protein M1823_005600 [Watsoniomyces obsoletus]
MPKPMKKRGPRHERLRARAEKKKSAEQQHEDEAGEHDTPLEDQYVPLTASNADEVKPFYGMLSEQEQEYFTRADEMLEFNQFGSPEDRTLFLANVFQEARGKELKIAVNAACSRLMERMILLSSPTQLKDLFKAFNGQFLSLVQHRFASHCCETLFLQAAPVVSAELTAPLDHQPELSDDQIFVSMENMFLYMLHELEGHYGALVVNQYSSHSLRVLMVILSGLPLARVTTTTLLKQKNKEDVGIKGLPSMFADQTTSRAETLPSSFAEGLEKMMAEIASGLQPLELGTLATHPIGNPVLQLLVELESMEPWKGHLTPERSILQKLLVNESLNYASSRSFIHQLLYDPVGSFLLEKMVRFAPGKTFKTIYRQHLKEKIGDAVEHDVAAFVIQRALERLGKDELQEAADQVLARLGTLVQRSKFDLIRTIMERYVARDLDVTSIVKTIEKVFSEESPSGRLQKIIKWEDEPNVNPEEEEEGDDEDAEVKKHKRDRSHGRVHGSMLAQTMLKHPSPLADFVHEGLLDTPAPTLLRMATNSAASRLLQAALVDQNATIVLRRRLLAPFFGQVATLASDPVGSHLVDALWPGTQGLPHLRERIAQELLQAEGALLASFHGRSVWRNWKMGLYKARRLDWIALGKTGGRPLSNRKPTVQPRWKTTTGVAPARKRHAAMLKQVTQRVQSQHGTLPTKS